jgi:hypothetical protein
VSYAVHHGKCEDVLPTLPAASFDACFCDPPYGLSFMGKAWDHGVPSADVWRDVLRALKPGAFLLAFGGTRTYHRLAVAIEDAGFEIRDCLMWLYSQGFPKSLNFGCRCRGGALPYNHEESPDGARGLRGLWQGVSEASVLGQANQESLLQLPVQRHPPGAGMGEVRTPRESGMDGGIEGELCAEDERSQQPGMEGRRDLLAEARELQTDQVRALPGSVSVNGAEGSVCDGASACDGAAPRASTAAVGSCPPQKPRPARQPNRQSATVLQQRGTQEGGGRCETCGGVIGFEGFGTSLKPSYEPIILAMKPTDGTYAANALKHGVAGINVNACRIGTTTETHASKPRSERNGFVKGFVDGTATVAHDHGRWPSNVLLDPESAALVDEQSGESASVPDKGKRERGSKVSEEWWAQGGGGFTTVGRSTVGYADQGGASRFFYIAKADSSERHASGRNTHPTVKPIDLAAYISRLILPPQRDTPRRLLVPFCGSGSEIIGALRAGWDHVEGIEREAAYVDLAHARIIGDAPLLNGSAA